MLKTVAERHVKILPEPSLQLSSGDVRSASLHAREEPRRGSSGHATDTSPSSAACATGNKAESGCALMQSWGTLRGVRAALGESKWTDRPGDEAASARRPAQG